MENTSVFERVRQLLVEVLSVEPAAIVPASRILPDLGAESIDLLDLRFRIEKSFGVKVGREELVSAFGESLTESDFRSVFTVGALCDYLQRRLDSARL